jgi:transcriptional antiterminator NusG
MAKQPKSIDACWYVLHTYSGYEHAVKEALLQRIDTMNMQDKIFDVLVPEETEIDMGKGGEVKEMKKRMFPGYVLVNMIVTDDSWYVVRNTPNVTGFVGSGSIPVPLTEDEIENMKKKMGVKEAKYKNDFKLKESVQIIEGPFKGYDGLISEIDTSKGKLKILVSIFGRETPVELSFNQVKQI